MAPQWDAYCGDNFERMCREALPLLYEAERVTGKFEVGEFWDRETQIDVVGLRADSWVDLGECKWHGRPVPADIAREFAARAQRYPGKHRTLRPLLFLRAKPKVTPAVVTVYDLPALYGG